MTRGRTTGFEDVYRATYADVVRSAWAVCRDRAAAEEHAQEAYARAYARWRRLERGGHAVPWLHRVAINLAIDDVRSRRRRADRTPADTAVAPHLPDDALWLADHLRRLPRRQREAVTLRVLADLPEEQVAAVMACSTGTVKVHKKRGLERLRDLLGPTMEADRG